MMRRKNTIEQKLEQKQEQKSKTSRTRKIRRKGNKKKYIRILGCVRDNLRIAIEEKKKETNKSEESSYKETVSPRA